MENRSFFFSWLNLYRIFIFLHQLRISHLTCLTLPGSLDHRISIWMFRRSPWSDSAKAEGGKPAKSSWRQWRMRDVLWMTCRHTSWRSEKKRRKWRLVTSTTSAVFFPVEDEPPNRMRDLHGNCPKPPVIHHPLYWRSVQSLYFANVAYDSTDDALRHRWVISQQKRGSRSPGCMYVKWGAIENQMVRKGRAQRWLKFFFLEIFGTKIVEGKKSWVLKLRRFMRCEEVSFCQWVPAQTVWNSIAHEISQPIRCRWF